MERVTNIENYVINKVKNLRHDNNMSQAELAFLMNVSNGFIGKVESYKYSSKFNLNHINKLAKIFNCSPKDFLPDESLEEK